ncbi:MDR family MFS transporter [Candidatus Bipolaricaulota bacterium]
MIPPFRAIGARWNAVYSEFPRPFWVLILGIFVDMFGRSSVQLFLVLFFTQRFGIDLSQAGVLLLLFTVSAMIGRTLGGALTDKFGRRRMIVFGIIASALSSLVIPFIPTLSAMYPVIVVAGLVASIGGPARFAALADLLPPAQRKEGFSIARVAVNLAWISGPILGGFLFDVSYLSIFILDAVTSLIVAWIVFRGLPETAPSLGTSSQGNLSLVDVFAGYLDVLRDWRYMLFLIPIFLITLAYRQSFGTLSVFLRDIHGAPAWYLGVLFSFDGFLVVLLQVWLTRRTRDISPHIIMAVGAFLYSIGFALFGFVQGLALFMVAKFFIVFGEMLYDPAMTAESFAYAPDRMRGRYTAIRALARSSAIAVAPILGGLVMEAFSPFLVWYLAGGLALVVGVIYFLMPNPRTQ